MGNVIIGNWGFYVLTPVIYHAVYYDNLWQLSMCCDMLQ